MRLVKDLFLRAAKHSAMRLFTILFLAICLCACGADSTAEAPAAKAKTDAGNASIPESKDLMTGSTATCTKTTSGP